MAMRAGLLRFPPATVAVSGLISLLAIVLLDTVARKAGVRLVPIYVPTLCVFCWLLGRRQALIFATISAFIAVLPDILVMREPLMLATGTNAVIRVVSYMILATIVIEHRRMYDEADLRAMYDGTTGALNSSSFHASVEQQLSALRRTRQWVLAAYLDLDDFKQINDNHGHAAGDAALRAFAQGARASIRGSDLVGRLGGDEFGFFLSAHTSQQAEALVRLLHERLGLALTKTGLPLTCSMGAMIRPAASVLQEPELFRDADDILRRAKMLGKNRVLIEVAQS